MICGIEFDALKNLNGKQKSTMNFFQKLSANKLELWKIKTLLKNFLKSSSTHGLGYLVHLCALSTFDFYYNPGIKTM